MPISDPRKYAIIIVDDDEAVRDSLSILLVLEGYSVSTCKSGADLLDLLEVEKPDCLILDVHMPVISGLDLVEVLNTKGLKIPVIFISGNIDVMTKARAEQLGVSRLLEKPFSDDLIFESISFVVN